MVCYIPIAGVVSLWLTPAIWAKEISDFLFILPAYLAFFGHPKIWRSVPLRIPRLFLSAMGGLALLVILEAFNPQVINWRMAAIGIKVWLFYMPLVILGYFWLETRSELLKVLRLLVVLSWVPATLGFIEFVGCHWFGYKQFMTLIYGQAAVGATQGFALFTLGNGTLFRIPSTFAFSTQYMNYLMAALALSFAFMQSEQSPRWKRFGTLTFYWILFAAYLCGSRAAFAVTPVMVVALCLLDKNGVRDIPKVLGVIFLMFIALKLPAMILSVKVFVQNISLVAPVLPSPTYPAPGLPKETADISLPVWGRMMQSLMVHHSYNVGYMSILTAFKGGVLGKGTGMNTGAARYALPDPSMMSGFENYYAKTIAELGVLGLGLVMTCFSSLLFYGFRIYREMSQPLTRQVAGAIFALLAIFTIYNFKGLMIDLDPMNIYFWLLAGVLFKLPVLDKT